MIFLNLRILSNKVLLQEACHKFPGENKSQPEKSLTISIGFASYPENGKNKNALIKKADDALYIAKSQGRNRVIKAK